MSEDFLGIDLKIDTDTRDVVLDPQGEPELVRGRACLGQDLRHRLVTDPDLLGYLGADVGPGDVRDIEALAVVIVERDPRVVPGRTAATMTQADSTGLTLEVELLPVGQDNKLNLVVRLGGFAG